MSEESNTPVNPRDNLKLKLPEPGVSVDQLWSDDVLGRAAIAERLTNLIRNQSAPFVISIHGHWGTGKTFLLKRWQKDLEKSTFKAIYFNAWEDDFCDDPLVAILGQLSEYFREGSFKSLADKVAEVAIPLVWQNIRGVFEKHAGISLVLDQSNEARQDPLESYLSQRTTKDKLKGRLREMSDRIRKETGHPMVFIIDELDRCRPTFAIELLERVKHIFDVPNLIFVFGINRVELCKSLESLYGNIDSTVYLRRFFDMELTLPEVDAAAFGSHLMQKYELGEFFDALSRDANNNVHTEHFGVLFRYFPMIWGHMGLSLRDIDYCVRLISLAGANLESRQHMYPWLLGALIPLQLKNSTLYRSFVQGNSLGSEVMNFIDETVPSPSPFSEMEGALNRIEVFLYISDYNRVPPTGLPSSPLEQLKLLQNGGQLTYPKYLSERTKKSDSSRIAELISLMSIPTIGSASINIGHLANLIGLHQELVRR